MPLAKCWRREGYQRARSQATTRHRASVVILVDSVRSKRNGITRRPWSCNRVEMLAAKADFPTPGDPLIQMTLCSPTLLISILCRMAIRVPFMHGARRRSLFPPTVRTKSFSSCVTRISTARSVTSWTSNLSTFFCNSITLSFWGTARMYMAGPTTQLKSHLIQINTHRASSRASCEWNSLLLPSSQEIRW